ncbi:hypothetical protein E5672_05580 [Alteromonas portus]|uniref:OmpR/PhoB-type domain-containing protein n=1 Tax=Alteromonas portus TaxID=2565549 RepID=A0A4U0ZHT5_9ALTE|nr:winged helix-turn-helix domain-containing protein [Alteromonas portus]TKB04274.1 hypothetical protein E5672_05580 [Alteromonas portus]
MDASACFKLNGFKFNRTENTVEKSGVVVKLTNKVSEVLALLLNANDEVVTRDILLQEVWPNRFGADESLSRVISDLRKKLELLEPGLSSAIETIPKRGYKFNTSVIKTDPNETVSVKKPTPSNRLRYIGFVTATLVIVTVLGGYFSRNTQKLDLALDGVAVLTFDDLSNESNLKSLPVGITEEILQILASETDMRVISRKSSHYFSEQTLPITEVARELGVRFLVEGTIQYHDSRVKISTRIIDGKNGKLISNGSFSFDGSDIFNIQRDVARSIALTTSSLSIAVQQNDSDSSINYNDQLQFLSLKASLLNLAPENLEALQEDVQQLVKRNPDFQDAQFLLSSIFSIRANWVQIEEAVALEMSSAILKGKEEANKLNALFWFAKAMMISPRATTPRSGDASLALEYFEKAFSLEPHNTLILEWYLAILQVAGKADYAKQLAEMKLESDPYNGTLLNGLAMYHYTHGQYELSRKYALRLSAVDQIGPEGPARLAYIHVVKNEIVETDAQAQECLARSIRFMNCWVHKAEVHEYTGEKKVLSQIHEVMKKLAPPVTKTLTLHELNHSESENRIERIEAYLSSVKEYDFNVGFFPQVYLYAVSQVPNGQQERYVDLALSKVSNGQAILFKKLLYPNDVSNELPIVEEITRALENNNRSRYYDYYLAQLYTQMGQYSDALDILATLINDRSVPVSFERFYGIESDPFFHNMRDIPRFKMLLEKHEENKLVLKMAISENNKTANVIEKAMAL